MEPEPCIITLSKNEDPDRGNLSYIEKDNHIPFSIEQTSWIYNVPGDIEKKGHAFKNRENFIIALSGSLEVVINNGQDNKIFNLNAANKGLYVPAGLWQQMKNFSTNAMVIILGSTKDSEEDFIRNYKEFLRMRSI